MKSTKLHLIHSTDGSFIKRKLQHTIAYYLYCPIDTPSPLAYHLQWDSPSQLLSSMQSVSSNRPATNRLTNILVKESCNLGTIAKLLTACTAGRHLADPPSQTSLPTSPQLWTSWSRCKQRDHLAYNITMYLKNNIIIIIIMITIFIPAMN